MIVNHEPVDILQDLIMPQDDKEQSEMKERSFWKGDKSSIDLGLRNQYNNKLKLKATTSWMLTKGMNLWSREERPPINQMKWLHW